MAKLKEILGESYSQIPEDLQKKYENIDLVDSSKFVEESELNEANKKITQYEKDIKKHKKDLEDLQEKAKGNEELNKEIERLKLDNEQSAKDFDEELKKVKFDAALDKKLGDFSPQNIKMLKKALEMEKISLDGENFIGLEDQINKLKESDGYLFKEESKGGTGNPGGGPDLLDDSKGNLSLGARLAEQRKNANQVTEAQNKFFS